MNKIPLSFYQNPNVAVIAKSLIGKFLFTCIDDDVTGGMIAETEAYAGTGDKASHSFGGRRTARTETMYMRGGLSYVYFTYGMHHLFNIVTSVKEDPQAVLIRGIIPTAGVGTQLKRRNQIKISLQLTNGPAKLCQALGITLKHNGVLLSGNMIWLEGRGEIINPEDIIAGPRVGIAFAQDDALLPFRFILKHSDYKPVKYR